MFTVVEDDPKKIAELREQYPDIPVVQGVLTARTTLNVVEKANVALICIANRDDDTLLIVREMMRINPKLIVYARLYDEALVQFIEDMGARSFSSSKFAVAKLKNDLVQ
ncbi:MAG: hypothetical protein RBG13Loki_4268 [Promethearchaeota archaeon CR_4]|nr:MAG: hypothetical protein RBG13Loki_4268 [Candidatus Lokiarchaeota archaeon CR_4]